MSAMSCLPRVAYVVLRQHLLLGNHECQTRGDIRKLYTVEQHLSGLFRAAGYPDMQKILLIGFFFENRLQWQFEV
jgi:hypothetical protein